MPCGFCEGTGWAPPGVIVSEVTPSIRKKQQLIDTSEDFERFKVGMARLGEKDFDKLSAKLRRSLRIWAVRLQARLNSLAHDRDVDLSAVERNRLLAALGALDAHLTMLNEDHENGTKT